MSGFKLRALAGDVMLNHSNIGWKDWLFMPLRPSLLIERPKETYQYLFFFGGGGGSLLD